MAVRSQTRVVLEYRMRAGPPFQETERARCRDGNGLWDGHLPVMSSGFPAVDGAETADRIHPDSRVTEHQTESDHQDDEEHRPRGHGRSNQSRRDQSGHHVQRVEPCAGSHRFPFRGGAGFAPSILVGVMEIRSPG